MARSEGFGVAREPTSSVDQEGAPAMLAKKGGEEGIASSSDARDGGSFSEGMVEGISASHLCVGDGVGSVEWADVARGADARG